MATSADITAQIATAQALALTSAQMVALCDLAMAQFMVGKPTASITIGGKSISFSSIEILRGVREYYTTASAPGDAPFICSPGEF